MARGRPGTDHANKAAVADGQQGGPEFFAVGPHAVVDLSRGVGLFQNSHPSNRWVISFGRARCLICRESSIAKRLYAVKPCKASAQQRVD